MNRLHERSTKLTTFCKMNCLQTYLFFSVVLNEKQRKAKRKLIEDNRERRKEEEIRHKIKDSGYDQDALTDHDRGLICEVVTAYEYTAGKATAKVKFSAYSIL